MSNTNPVTGIRYGVISMHSIDGDVANDLWYGPGATDLSYQAAYEEAKADAETLYDRHMEEAEIAASETDHNMSDAEREAFIEDWFERNDIEFDKEVFVDSILERHSDMCCIDEPNIEGVYDGVHYLISWLGGAPLLRITQGPLAVADRLCSPCVPNAADLDGGYALASEVIDSLDGNKQTLSAVLEAGFQCYGVPRDWLNDWKV